jgi:ABC-2 type transport system ATP-binding protein
VSADASVVRVEGLTRRFGSLVALDHLDLEIQPGEVFGFLGPNGAGKSTLMRILTGLLAPSEGRVEVLGCSLPRQVDALRPRVGYMTQRFSLYDDLTVLENLEFAGEVFGLDRETRNRRIAEALEEHGLTARRNQFTGTLSGGWKQRLALAASTLHGPELIFLDEPTAGVDPERRRAFWEKLFDLASEGTTVLVSTHYMDEAIRCNRICMLRDGRRAVLGSPARLVRALAGRVVEILADPAETAADLLGARPEVTSVTQLGDKVHVLLASDLDSPEEVGAALPDLLAQEGVWSSAATAAEPTLEDVFVALSKGEQLEEAVLGGG